jgi:hypothetical protein
MFNLPSLACSSRFRDFGGLRIIASVLVRFARKTGVEICVLSFGGPSVRVDTRRNLAPCENPRRRLFILFVLHVEGERKMNSWRGNFGQLEKSIALGDLIDCRRN